MTRSLLLLGLLASCSSGDDWAERVRPALDASDARAAAIDVPAATGLEAPQLESAARLYLTADAAVLDLTPTTPLAFEPDVPESTRAAFLPGPPLAFATIRDGALSLPDTLDAEGHATGDRLGAVLERAHLRRSDLHHVAVFAERGLPARVVAQTLAVLSILGTVSAELRFSGPAGPVGATVSVRAPTDAIDLLGPSRDAPPTEDELQLELARVDGGFALTTSGGHVERDCRHVSDDPHVTVPDHDAAPSAIALTRCLRAVDETFPITTLHLRADSMAVDELPLIFASVREVASGTVHILLLPGPRPLPPPPASLLDLLERDATGGITVVGS